jgi:hypothetical protein
MRQRTIDLADHTVKKQKKKRHEPSSQQQPSSMSQEQERLMQESVHDEVEITTTLEFKQMMLYKEAGRYDKALKMIKNVM